LKDIVFSILYDNRDSFVSGEEISNKLGVSRTAVWKAISQLRREGCQIESFPNRGYCLTQTPDRLNKVLLDAHLSTHSMGRVVELHSSIDSTNARAKELAQGGAVHGTLVIAEEQTSGRGRLGRSWVSPAGMGIWMSLILRPSFLPRNASRVTVITALAVTDAIDKITGLTADIKWPNDIIINSRKVCGILTEIQADPDTIEYLVVGIGLNVNTPRDAFPEELTQSASSLFMESGVKVERNILLAGILDSFERIYNKYEETESFTAIMDDYKAQCITLNKRVKVFGRTEEFEGTAVDLTDNCELIVQLDDGTLKNVLSGDVSVRGIAGYAG